MNNDYALLTLRPKAHLIGRETPGITLEIFRMCAERRAKQELRKERWKRFIKFTRMSELLKLFRMNSFEVSPVDN